jgi:hypothetical protein
MDSTFILYTVKWVLAEFLRLTTSATPADIQRAVDQVIERRVNVLWKPNQHTRVLDTSFKTRQQVLILLYDRSPQSEGDLLSSTEYSNTARFKRLLGDLHEERLIEYSESSCTLSPTGSLMAEALLLEANAKRR